MKALTEYLVCECRSNDKCSDSHYIQSRHHNAKPDFLKNVDGGENKTVSLAPLFTPGWNAGRVQRQSSKLLEDRQL